MKKQIQKGFTLIELMIVIAIIGVLAAIALPAYQVYVGRAQMAESLQLLDGVKSTVTEYHASQGEWPVDNNTAGINIDPEKINGNYVKEVRIKSGVITATMKSSGVARAIQGATVTFKPTASTDGSYKWDCDSTAGNQYLPAVCR